MTCFVYESNNREEQNIGKSIEGLSIRLIDKIILKQVIGARDILRLYHTLERVSLMQPYLIHFL